MGRVKRLKPGGNMVELLPPGNEKKGAAGRRALYQYGGSEVRILLPRVREADFWTQAILANS